MKISEEKTKKIWLALLQDAADQVRTGETRCNAKLIKSWVDRHGELGTQAELAYCAMRRTAGLQAAFETVQDKEYFTEPTHIYASSMYYNEWAAAGAELYDYLTALGTEDIDPADIEEIGLADLLEEARGNWAFSRLILTDWDAVRTMAWRIARGDMWS